MDTLVDFLLAKTASGRYTYAYRSISGTATCVQVLFHIRSLAGSPSSGRCGPESSKLNRAVNVRFTSPSPGMHHNHHLRILSLMQNIGYDRKITMENSCQQKVN